MTAEEAAGLARGTFNSEITAGGGGLSRGNTRWNYPYYLPPNVFIRGWAFWEVRRAIYSVRLKRRPAARMRGYAYTFSRINLSCPRE